MPSYQKNGAILMTGYNMTVTEQLAFTDALIRETVLPTLDASSKDAGKITLKLAPTSLADGPGSGSLPAATKSTKKWMLANFRLDIPDVDTSHVSKIDSFSVTQPIGDGHQRSGPLDFGDLAVTIAASHADTWKTWFDHFVIEGENGDTDEKRAILGLLSPTLDYLAHVVFCNLGIYRLEELPASIGNAAENMVAHLYYERAEFHLGVPLPEVCRNCYVGP